MSYSSKVIYEGDGVTTDFNVPMPYVSTAHISVYVNEALRLNGMHYRWTNSSTISFDDAPGQGSAIRIQRWTSPANPLVDFSDGSTLRADDLDLAYLHNFYLSQEYADSFNELINNTLLSIAAGTGIVETETDAIIAALVNEMLNDANAANLQARINDIDANAEAIITLGESLQVQINTLSGQVAGDVFIQPDEPIPGVGGVPDPIAEGSRWYDSDDNNHPYVYTGGEWLSIDDPRVGQAAADITALQVQTDNTNAALLDEMFVRSTETTALGSRLSLVGAESGDGQAFVLNLDTAYVGENESLADRFTVLSAADDANAASILSEQTARIAEDESLASDITSLTASVNGNSANITTNATAIASVEDDVTTLYAKYGVTLNVNGYITGFAQNNDGTTGTFVILADKFGIANPGNPDLQPFTVSNNKIVMNGDVSINGSLIVNGSIIGAALVPGTIGTTQIGPNAIDTDQLNAGAVTASKIEANQITATHIGVSTVAALGITTGSLTVDGALTMNTAGYIRNNTTTYSSGSGFFLGYDSGSPAGYKFRIGNTTDNFLRWDGSKLEVIGDILVGEYTASDNTILSATTERSNGTLTYVRKKTFTIDRAGSVKVSFDVRLQAGGTNTNGAESASVRVYQNSTLRYTQGTFNSTDTTFSYTVQNVAAGDKIHLDLKGGTRWITGDQALENRTGYINDCFIKADVALTTGGSVDLN